MLIRFKTPFTTTENVDIFIRSESIDAIGVNGDRETIILVGGEEITVLETPETVFRLVDEASFRLDKFESIREESTGVDGFHLNGEIATWEELGL
jgi:hypothetical protein